MYYWCLVCFHFSPNKLCPLCQSYRWVFRWFILTGIFTTLRTCLLLFVSWWAVYHQKKKKKILERGYHIWAGIIIATFLQILSLVNIFCFIYKERLLAFYYLDEFIFCPSCRFMSLSLQLQYASCAAMEMSKLVMNAVLMATLVLTLYYTSHVQYKLIFKGVWTLAKASSSTTVIIPTISPCLHFLFIVCHNLKLRLRCEEKADQSFERTTFALL